MPIEFFCLCIAKEGSQIIVPYRGDVYDLRELRVLGDLGQILFTVRSIIGHKSYWKCLKWMFLLWSSIWKAFSCKRWGYNSSCFGIFQCSYQFDWSLQWNKVRLFINFIWKKNDLVNVLDFIETFPMMMFMWKQHETLLDWLVSVEYNVSFIFLLSMPVLIRRRSFLENLHDFFNRK